MSSNVRVEECTANHDNHVLVMTGMSDQELSKKLDLVHIQMEIAEKTKNTSSLELLEVWRQQIIEARILKAENQIPDQPSEIELAIADIETVVAKTEEREKILTKNSDLRNENIIIEKKLEMDSPDNQLSLF